MAEVVAQPGVALGRTVIAARRSLVKTGVSRCDAGRRLDQAPGPDLPHSSQNIRAADAGTPHVGAIHGNPRFIR
jgi:hypothetical protein